MNESSATAPTRIAVTLGDPAGVGPEVVAKALARRAHAGQRKTPEAVKFLIIGAERHWRRGLEIAGIDPKKDIHHRLLEDEGEIDWSTEDEIQVLEPIPGNAVPPIEEGRVSAVGGEAAYHAVTMAARLAMEDKVDAICTAPLSKQALRMAGYAYPGHTELLARLAGDPKVVMLLQGGGLRVSLVTIHIPLSETLARITPVSVYETIRVTYQALKDDWAIKAPRLSVTGLNPHAGEGGVLGAEERDIIAPAIKKARDEGMDVFGPWPGDTVYYHQLQGGCDAVVAMYHDQALGPLKTLAFNEGVNITLGLPFIRTSPDHGTAMDIAGKNQASPASMVAALRDAIFLATNRQNALGPK